MSSLQIGRLVRVVMARNNIFRWQEDTDFIGVLEQIPSGPGDTFDITVEHPNGKCSTIAINGNSSEFVAIEQTSIPDKQEDK